MLVNGEQGIRVEQGTLVDGEQGMLIEQGTLVVTEVAVDEKDK